MKAILVIDINDELLEDYENFYVDYDLRAEKKGDNVNESIKYVEEAELKPIPQKQPDIMDTDGDYGFDGGWNEGYNACIDEITGETK